MSGVESHSVADAAPISESAVLLGEDNVVTFAQRSPVLLSDNADEFQTSRLHTVFLTAGKEGAPHFAEKQRTAAQRDDYVSSRLRTTFCMHSLCHLRNRWPPFLYRLRRLSMSETEKSMPVLLIPMKLITNSQVKLNRTCPIRRRVHANKV